MKRIWSVISLVIFVMTTFSACDKTEEAEWRDANINFMSSVAHQDGIKYLGSTESGESGIYYEILQNGDTTSRHLLIGDEVKVDYIGWLYNDTTEFESDNDYEVTIGSSVINGWSLVLQKMHVGDVWRVYIPYYQAYGSSSYSSIPAYSALIFNIYLQEILTTD